MVILNTQYHLILICRQDSGELAMNGDCNNGHATGEIGRTRYLRKLSDVKCRE